MNEKPLNLVPLIFILIGSATLAIPGAGGGIFLFIAAIDALAKPFKANGDTNLFMLLLPMPVIFGFLLLAGYIWTMVKKRFVKWFWLISAGFNLLITLLCVGFMFKRSFESFNTLSTNDLPKILFFLFPMWTLFVTIASVRYAFYKPKTENYYFP